MDYNDMIQYFTSVQVCKWADYCEYSYVKTEGSLSYIKVSITQDGRYTFSISQKGERMFPRGSGYKYSNSRLALIQETDDGMNYIKGGYGYAQRDTYLEFDELEAGNYWLICDIKWHANSPDQ